MSRLAVFFALLALLTPAPGQIFSPGPPASATSPTADGRLHGVPASVVSPPNQTLIPGRAPVFFSTFSTGRPLRPFGTHHRRQVFVPVPVFYPAYFGGGYDSAYPSVADPSVGATDSAQAQNGASGDAAPAVESSEDALRAAYVQGVRDALTHQTDSRYGQRSPDQEPARVKPPAAETKAPAANTEAASKPALDDSPATVFIFKDGHQIETRNFAIMGQTLYDFSSTSLKKVQLTDLDTAATQKANDDRGIIVKLQ